MTPPVRLVQILILVATSLGADPGTAQPASDSAPSNGAPVDEVRAATNNASTAANKIGPSGNPLWAIPLATLSATRERPIFSPTRRPPAVASVAMANPIVRIPDRIREPERPQLALVGTIIGEKEAFGVFVDDATKGAIRLRRGDDYHGWVLRVIHAREATLEKDEQTTTLSLPRLSEEFAKSISRRSR